MMLATTPRRRKGSLLPDGAGAYLRRRAEEVVGLALMIAALALLLAWLSYVPDDPSPLRSGPGPIHNLLGSLGAAFSDVGVQTLGTGYLLFIGIVAAWGWRLFAHRGLTRVWLRLSLLPASLFAAAITAGALPRFGGAALPSGPGGAIGTLALGKLAGLGPLLGGVSSGTIGLAMAGLTTGLTVLTLGFSPAEWKRMALASLRGVRRGSRAAAAGAIAGAQAARAGIEALRGRAEPHFGLPSLGGPASSAPTPSAPTSFSDEPPPATEPVAQPSLLPELRGEARPAAAGMALPAVARKPARGLVEPRLEEKKPPPRKPAPQQTALDLTPNEGYRLPPTELLNPAPPSSGPVMSEEALADNARLLEQVLSDFGVRGEIVKVRPGPVVALYELEPAPGTKSSRVIGLADDIARSMSAIAVRIAVVPGRSVIGIELPNARRETVYLREILTSDAYETTAAKLALILGKDIGGTPVVVDLARMPHLLIAGTTGSGKSVGINTMILSLVFRMPPEKCRFIMIDPKMLELSVYDGIPHLLAPVVTDPKKAVVALKWTVREMETRYRAMSKLGVRNIEGYNGRVDEITKSGEQTSRRVQVGFDEETGEPLFEDQPLNLYPLPYIVVVVDEMADLMLVAGKDIEGAIQRLAQMARAAGIHLIMATQRPSVDVITGTIKANFPTRISFQVTSKIDSRTILGEGGAEQLLGQGDMLSMAGGGRVTRVHGPFVSDSEVEQVVKFLKSQGAPSYVDAVTEDDDEDEALDEAAGRGGDEGGSGDDLYDQAVALVARERKASTSFIQRHLQIGYNRAARLIERMESEGVVGQANHVGKREVLIGRGPE